jgi:quercetin dioxygenase-like cupin family protein
VKLIKASDCEYYEAKKHFNCWTGHKVTPDVTSKRLNISYSHFLPNGGAEMCSSPLERVYYLLTGSMAVKGKDEQEFIMQPGDMVYIAPNEERAVRILGPEVATMMVIMSKVD